MTKADLIAMVRYARLDSKAIAFERDEARDRAGNLSVELAAMTLNRDELRQALERAYRARDAEERSLIEWQDRAGKEGAR
jgi:hypothetical protein